MGRTAGEKVKITPELKSEVLRIHNSAPGGWRQFPEKLRSEGRSWPASFSLANQIALGNFENTSPIIYDALGLERPPVVLQVEIPHGTPIFGEGEQGILGNAGVTVIEDSGVDGAGLLFVPKETAHTIKERTSSIKEGLIILSRLETRTCRHPECQTEFPKVHNRQWCTAHDSSSPWYQTKEAANIRKSLAAHGPENSLDVASI